jgi:hypothetical protein
MTTFKNFTPHPIALNSGTVFQSEGIARVSASFSEPVNGICEQVFGAITGLPDSEENTLFIVSGIVLSAAVLAGRTDCVAPATGHPLTVRNEAGHIVSVPCFVK